MVRVGRNGDERDDRLGRRNVGLLLFSVLVVDADILDCLTGAEDMVLAGTLVLVELVAIVGTDLMI